MITIIIQLILAITVLPIMYLTIQELCIKAFYYESFNSTVVYDFLYLANYSMDQDLVSNILTWFVCSMFVLPIVLKDHIIHKYKYLFLPLFYLVSMVLTYKIYGYFYNFVLQYNLLKNHDAFYLLMVCFTVIIVVVFVVSQPLLKSMIDRYINIVSKLLQKID